MVVGTRTCSFCGVAVGQMQLLVCGHAMCGQCRSVRHGVCGMCQRVQPMPKPDNGNPTIYCRSCGRAGHGTCAGCGAVALWRVTDPIRLRLHPGPGSSFGPSRVEPTQLLEIIRPAECGYYKVQSRDGKAVGWLPTTALVLVDWYIQGTPQQQQQQQPALPHHASRLPPMQQMNLQHQQPPPLIPPTNFAMGGYTMGAVPHRQIIPLYQGQQHSPPQQPLPQQMPLPQQQHVVANVQPKAFPPPPPMLHHNDAGLQNFHVARMAKNEDVVDETLREVMAAGSDDTTPEDSPKEPLNEDYLRDLLRSLRLTDTAAVEES